MHINPYLVEGEASDEEIEILDLRQQVNDLRDMLDRTQRGLDWQLRQRRNPDFYDLTTVAEAKRLLAAITSR